MNNRGILVVLSGFSGAGKGTLMKRLFELHGEEYALSVSATTRKPREGEEEGKAYFFKTNEEFEKMIQEDAFLEYAGYCDHYYGTPRAYVEEQLEKGKNVILEIEIQGAHGHSGADSLCQKRPFMRQRCVFYAPEVRLLCARSAPFFSVLR